MKKIIVTSLVFIVLVSCGYERQYEQTLKQTLPQSITSRLSMQLSKFDDN
jgi:hypothetical protein